MLPPYSFGPTAKLPDVKTPACCSQYVKHFCISSCAFGISMHLCLQSSIGRPTVGRTLGGSLAFIPVTVLVGIKTNIAPMIAIASTSRTIAVSASPLLLIRRDI